MNADGVGAGAGAGAEIRALLSFLDGQRRHVLGILEGLDEGALHKPVLPSGWSCLGLVQHLALDVERFWFRAVFAGDREVIDALDDIDDAWQVAPTTPSADILLRYRVTTETACHAGHLDATRELIDGRRWMVLT
uniref:DinB family protein n=1 Tax=Streptomyces sp. NBC_01401 TaxID=2903854 RepID=A0AAU3GW92_9ACTN